MFRNDTVRPETIKGSEITFLHISFFFTDFLDLQYISFRPLMKLMRDGYQTESILRIDINLSFN